ncbi:DUF5821 family protein [Haladaptatus sp. DJG-WS-42]|uniref:transcriptional regulator TbsP n=1 Tax=Haladaptatus sp. DJG-WS-42 TaxID=3120516 RepID=UPI0030D12556
MSSNLLEPDIEGILRATLENASGDVLVVNPSDETVEELVSVLADLSDAPSVQVLADDSVLKDVMADFIVASTAADLIEAETLALHTVESRPENSLLITEDSVVAVVAAGDRVAGLSTDDDAFIKSANEMYADLWEQTAAFTLRTPPISRVRSSLSEDLGSTVGSDFEGVLSSLETARGDGDGLDEVTISLLVAAKNEALLYDISKWGEDVGIASKATFSRTKTKLEDMGLITTEKVPIDVGRPRLRLMLGDERLRGAKPDQLASVAQSILN